MQKNYLLFETKPTQIINAMLQKLNCNQSGSLKLKAIHNVFVFLLLMVTNLGFSQLPENFESGIPATWTVTSNLATPPINNNWTATTLGYSPTAPTPPNTNGVLLNPILNTTTGSTADYWLISPQITTITNGEFRFWAKQGSFSNKGTIYKVLATTGNPSDLTPANWTTLASWTEVTLNVAATTWQENVASTATLPAGISIHIALVAEVPTGKTGDVTYIDAIRYIPKCDPITGITTVLGSSSTVINWTGTSPNYSIYVVPTGQGHGTTGTPVVGTSYTATGLTPLTTYDVYVIANCDATTSSAWAGPFTFTTLAAGLNCPTAIQVPSDVTVTPYVYSNNLANFYDAVTYVNYNSQTLACQPPSTPSTYNLLSGDHAYFSFTPSTTGLVNITQAVNVASGGGGNNCYNAYSSLFVFNGCAGVGTSAGCLGGISTDSNTSTAQLSNFYVQAGQTYIILISSVYQHTNPGAGICFTLTISGSTCPAPAIITYSNLEQTSISASWNNAQNLVSAWEYLALPATSGTPIASQSGTPTTTNVNNPVTGLTPGTAYNLYVRAVCSGTPGPWSAPMPFTTLCNQLPLPYYTGFTGDSATIPEPCWTVLNLNNDANQFNFGNDWNSRSVAKLRTANGSNIDDMLITPQFHFDGVTQKRLRFKYNIYGNWGLIVNNPTGGPGSFSVLLSTTGVGASNFTTVLAPLASYTTAYNYIEMIIPIPANIVGDINIAWYLPQGSVQTGIQFYIDDVYIEDLPACSDPIYPAVTASSITSTSAQLTWTNGYNTSQWEIIAQPQGTGMPATNAIGTLVNTNPYTFTGLTPSTQYEFWIRSYCDATHQSNWVGPVNFYTTCIAQPTPYYESFNDGDITSKKFCWTVQDRNNDPATWVLNATEAEITPQNIDYFTPLVNFDDWLVSVPINIVGQKRLRYKYKVATDLFYPTPRADMEVLISNDPSFATYTTLIPEHEFTNAAYMEDSVIFTGTGVSYIAFRVPPTMTNPGNSGHLFIDDVYVEDPPACEVPSNLTASGMTTTTANLSWTLGYTETQWEVVVQTAGSGVPTGSGTVVNTTAAYPAVGLSPDTAYEYYVRAVCDATHSSAWVGPFAFRTTCNPLPTPFLETFDSNSQTKTCWTIDNLNGDSHYWNLNETVNPIFGDEMASMFTGSNGANDDWLITPTLMAHANQRLRFYYKVYNSSFEEDLKIKLSVNGTATDQFSTILYETSFSTTTDANGTLAGTNTITVASSADIKVGDTFYITNWPFPYGTTVTNVNGNVITMSANATITQAGVQDLTFTHKTLDNTDYKEMVINLTNITSPTNINLAFQIPFFPPNPWNYRGQYLFIDNVIVEDIPSCPDVANVAVVTANLLDTSAQIDWDPVGSETSWEVSLQPYGTLAPVGSTLPSYLHTTSTHPYTLTGLTPGTKYQFYVRAVCSSSSQSAWVGPFEFTTKCDLANVCQYTISVSNGSTGQVYNGINVMQNGIVVQQLTFPVVAPNQPTVIDYPVFLCTGVAFSLYFDVPIGASGTQYSQAQAVIKDQNNNVIWTSPLGLGPAHANIYDGFATCGTTTCPQPTNLTSNNQGVLSWTPGGTETQWEVYIQPVGNGTLPQSGHIVNSPSYTPVASDFVDATAGTYEYFVRAICGASNDSYWFGPQTFIRNDESANSIHLAVNSGTTCDVAAVNASFIGATASTEPTTCSGVNGGDIWYDFVATSKVHIIELSDFTPGSYYASSYEGPWPKIIMSLYEVQSDGSLLEKGCSENNSFVAMYSTELVVGHIYKIRLKLNDTVVNTKEFHICITTPVACDMNAFNYDFEKLSMQYVTGVSTIITTTVIPGWRTNTDTNEMFFQEASNSPGVIPYSGGQCLQLIQDYPASLWNPTDPNIKGLYKDFDTSEILQMDYSFASASRIGGAGTTVQLYAGPPSGPFTLVTEDTESSLSWNLVQGNYMVPTGQTTTRFIFRVKNYAIGHLLDAANFKPNTDIITPNTTLACATTSITVAAQGVGHWTADVANPAVTIIGTPNATTTTISGFNTSGTYIYHWITRYCDKTITIIYQGITETPVVVTPVQYCLNDIASSLTATVSSGYSIKWYTVAVGGTGSTTAPTPLTTAVGNSQVFYVCAVDGSGCEGPRVSIAVQINALPTITGTLSACVGNTTQLTGSDTAATTNPWVSSNTAVATVSATGLVTGVAAGTSTITYTNSNGCVITAIVTINALPTIAGTLTACVGNTTQLTGDGTAATTNAWVSSNTAIATVDATGLVTGVTSGTSTITYTNTNGCVMTAIVTINALPTITGTLSACVGNTTQLTGSGTAATTNAWVSSNTAIATVDATGLVTGVTSGTSTITYTNSNGCVITAIVTINALPTITGTLTACVGNTTQLTGSATAATSNAWVSSNTAIASVSATGLVTGVAAGTSTITYTNSNGCVITAIVTINALPTITGTLLACVGNTTQLTGSGTAATNNAWISSNTAVATVSATGLVTGVTSGTSTITYTNSNGCVNTAVVTINALPTITGTLTACVGNTTQLTGSGTAATTNAWVSSNTAVATVSATGLVTGVSAGTSTITYTNSNGCLITANVTINALPTITGTLTACVGSTTQLMGSGTAATTNAWVSSNMAVATVSGTGLVTGVAAGTSTITYTNSNGCVITAIVTINALPTITGTLAACVGSTTQLTGSGTAATSNAWVSSNTAVATVSATGVVTGVSAGTSTITYTNTNGCVITAIVTINALPTITSTLSACVGNTTQLTGSGTAATTNAWVSSTTAVATVSGTGLVSGVTAGTSTITYTNSNGCMITAIVTINALPTITGTLSACVGNTTQLTGSGTAATTNAWVSSTTAVATVSATGLVTGVSSGTATITYTNSNGCVITAIVTINALPIITGTLSACVGNTTQLTGSGTAATTNAWVSSNTSVATISATGLVTGVTTGTSTITYTNSNGCIVTATVSIVSQLVPTFNPIMACQNSTVAFPLHSLENITGTWTPNVINTATAGTTVYSFAPDTTIVGQACATTGSLSVTINALPTITGTLSACVGNTTQLTGSGTAATTNAWVSSNTAVATISATGLVTGVTAGTSTITYTNNTGCVITAIATINALPTITGTLSTCVGNATQLTGSGTAATTNAWVSSNTAVASVSATGLVTGVTAGTSTITYSNNNGCVVTANVSVTSQIVPTFSNIVACQNTTVAFPLHSLENITGTWTPNVIDTAIVGTTVYSFAPDTTIVGQACATTGSLSVTINVLPTIIGTLSACVGNTTQLTGSGTAATTNAWVSSNTAVATVSATGLVTGVTAGTSIITYTNNTGCLITANLTIYSLPTITGTLTACVGNTTQLTGSGTAATTNAWVSSNTAVATVSATGLVTGVSAGTTTITYTNANGCVNTAVVTINALPTITGIFTACAGSTTQLTGSGTAATTNAWISSNMVVATVSGTGLVTGVSAGTSTITYTNSNGCMITAIVTINALPTITGTLSACVGNTTQLTGSATAAITNAWVSSNTAVATVSGTGLVTGVSVGTSTITYTNSNGCVNTAIVTINALPTITGTLTACAGSTTQLTGSGIAATTNAWVSSNTAVATVSATGLVTGVTSGTSIITYTNSNGCIITAIVTINALPTITGTLTACAGSTTQLTGSGTAATTNAWVSSNMAVATVSGTGLVTGVSAGTSTITYTNSNGCVVTAIVTINALPTVSISGSTSICIGSTSTITFIGTPNAVVTYTINAGANQTITLNSSGSATITTAALSTTTTYNLVSVSSSTTSCSQSQTGSAVITINPLATPNVTFSYAQSCVNSAVSPTPVLPSNFTAGGVYSSTTLTVNSTTGAINLAGATAGSYQVTYTVAQNSANCTAGGTYTATIVLTSGVTPVTGFSYATSYCANSSNALPTLSTGFTVGGVFSSTSGLDINSATGEIYFLQSAPGNYTITYTVQSNASTCNNGGTSSFAITILNPVAFTIETVCQDQVLNLQVLPNNNSFNINDATYSWTNGSTTVIGTNSPTLNVDDYLTQNPSLSLPLTFNVLATLNGCSSGATFTVNNNPCKLIPKGISPNNDQVNDTFDLSGLGVTDLTIYNRYGTKVYSFSGNYTNQWGGLSNSGSELPDGTYFYSIQKNDGSNVTGWVFINK